MCKTKILKTPKKRFTYLLDASTLPLSFSKQIKNYENLKIIPEELENVITQIKIFYS